MGVEPLPAPDEKPDQKVRRLSVLASLPSSTLKAAFASTSKAVHPDKNPNSEACQAMQKVNQAWQILRDEKTRKVVDARLLAAASEAQKKHAEEKRKQLLKQKLQQKRGPQRTSIAKANAKTVKKDNLKKKQNNASKSASTDASKPQDSKQAATASKPEPQTDTPKPSESATSSTEPASKKTKTANSSNAAHHNSKTEAAKDDSSKHDSSSSAKKAPGIFPIKAHKNFISVKNASNATRKFSFDAWQWAKVAHSVATEFIHAAAEMVRHFEFSLESKKDKLSWLSAHGISVKGSRTTIAAMRDLLEEASSACSIFR